MDGKKINIPGEKPRILIAPLDWGLGHATRCIPIICVLIANGCEVIIAAENGVKALLEKEFPQLSFVPLSGYQITYSRQKEFLLFKLFLQFPKLLFSIYKEHRWLNKTVKLYKIDAIISDNRFGLWHCKIPCVYITHQLLIKTGNPFTEKIAQKIHYWFIQKYNACWVPDFKDDNNIAGELSHPKKILPNIIYLGGLSRFEKKAVTEKKYALVISISGPEPQRTILENSLLNQLQTFKEKVLFVRGLPNETINKQSVNEFVSVINHLSSAELNTAFCEAEYVISRSGYTTVMDLLQVQQKAILIPTPGQTEQEYLAKHLAAQKIFFYAEQENFMLTDALLRAKEFPFIIPSFDMNQYKNVVKEFVESLKQ
jgi:uncharacterized protein (TIGR00661 family)